MPLSRFLPLRGASLISSAELLREPRRTTADSKRRGQSRSQLSGLLPAQQQWQQNAWGYYRSCGELRQGVRWLSNACSQATLKLGRIDPRGDGTPDPVDDQALIDRYLASWAGGASGQSELLAQMAIHATVPGEWYLIAYADPATKAEVWRTVSKSAIQQLGTGSDSPLRIQIGPHEWVDLENGTSFVCRMWRPDPERPWLADSPVQPLLADLRILCGLTAHVNATIDSRLAGNGILAVPQEASLTGAETAPVDEEGTVREDNDEFMDELIENMVPAITDRDRASAVVPILIRARGEDIKNIQHIDISSKFDERSSELLVQAQRKVAIGMDVPPAVILGQEDSNHWTSWQISEEAVALHVNPLLSLITHPLTDRYLRPLMLDDGRRDADTFVIYADTTELTLRPDQSDDAVLLYDRGELSGESLRRESGFGDQDKPGDQEKRERLLWKLAENPQMAAAVLPALGITTGAGATSSRGAPDGQRQSAPGANARPAIENRRELPTEQPTTQRPTAPPTGTSGDGLMAAADFAVRRALEVAGRRMTPGRTAQLPQVPVWTMHTHIRAQTDLSRLLDGAWLHLGEYANAEGVAAVDRYTRHLITSQQAHEPAMLRRHLTEAGILR
ncbi:hypothetical protein [Streptomyces sp. NPDC057302]|uniref:hypothetical protein n=1 Tax=Streptomyces sp. NPDC057302 TaxID=3346094 RepID=UPI003626DE57